MSGDPDSEYFSDGITDDIITALTQVKGLRVAARDAEMKRWRLARSSARERSASMSDRPRG